MDIKLWIIPAGQSDTLCEVCCWCNVCHKSEQVEPSQAGDDRAVSKLNAYWSEERAEEQLDRAWAKKWTEKQTELMREMRHRCEETGRGGDWLGRVMGKQGGANVADAGQVCARQVRLGRTAKKQCKPGYCLACTLTVVTYCIWISHSIHVTCLKCSCVCVYACVCLTVCAHLSLWFVYLTPCCWTSLLKSAVPVVHCIKGCQLSPTLQRASWCKWMCRPVSYPFSHGLSDCRAVNWRA